MVIYDQCDCDYCRAKYKNKSCKKSNEKSCEENLNELIASAVNTENALANAINTESTILKNGDFTATELITFMNKLEKLLKLAIKKEIILDFLIEDAIEACEVHESQNKKDG